MAAIPAYIGPDGRLYDISYNALDPAIVETIFERFRETRDEREKAQNQQAAEQEVKEVKAAEDVAAADPQIAMFLPSGNWDVISKTPKPEAYESYYDFEQALLDWKAEVDYSLGYLRVPSVIGRAYHRPVFQLHDEDKTEVEPDEEPVAEAIAPASTTSETAPTETLADNASKEQVAASTPTVDPPGESTDKDSAAPVNVEGAEEEYEQQFEEIQEEASTDVPWDTHLVPPEPDPTLYESFEDYEQALVRWYEIAQEHLATNAPPEALQFKDLLGLTPVRVESTDDENKDKGAGTKDQDKKDGSEKKSATESRILWRSGFVPLHEPRFEPTIPPEPKSYHEYVWSNQNLYRRVSMDVRGNLHKVVDKLVDNLEQNKTKLGRQVPHVLPRLHGTFQRKNSQVSLKAQTNPIRPVRRTDLSVQMLAQCQDSPHKVDSQLVEFIVPEYDRPIEPKKLDEPAYVTDMRKSITDLQYIDWTAPNESWNYPVMSLDDQKKAIAAIKQSLSTSPVTGDGVRAIIEKNIMCDLFEEMLDSQIKTPQKTARVADVIAQGITAEGVDNIMSLMSDSCSEIVQSRLCSVLLRILCEPIAEQMLVPFVKDCKLLTMYRIASCIAKRLCPELELVAYDPEVFALVPLALKNKAVPELNALMSHVFLVYYLNIMTQACDSYDANFPNKSLSERMKHCRDLLFPSWSRIASANLGKQLQQCPEFVSELIFDVLNCRSDKLASTFLFVSVQLITNPSPLIQEILKSDATNLVQNVRELCCSRFMHTRFSGRQLHALLSTSNLWAEYFCKTYAKRDLLLDDLFDFRRRSSQPGARQRSRSVRGAAGMPGASPIGGDGVGVSECSLLTTLASDWIMNNIKLTGVATMHEFALDQFIFHGMLKVVLEAPRESISTGGGILILSALLAHMAKVCFTRDMIKAAKTPYNAKLRDVTHKGPGTLDIHHQDLKNILNFIVAVPQGPAGYGVKKNMLACLRHTLKQDEIFSLIKVEPDLYQKLINFCRDGTDHEFNRNSWSLFYQIIRYHNGVMEHLIKTNQLASFLEIVDTNAGKVIITNGLHYIGKLFKMHSLELARIEHGKKPARADAAKSVEKDVKAFITFYLKSRLFIRIHMVYQNFCSKRPGMAFYELCEFYRMLRDTPACKQLLKDLQKSGEYKEGIDKVLSMYDDVVPPPEKGKKK